MSVKRLYVCTRSLVENIKAKDCHLPPCVLRIDQGKEIYAKRVEIHGEAEFRFDLNGAHGDGQGPHMWVETEASVTVHSDVEPPITFL